MILKSERKGRRIQGTIEEKEKSTAMVMQLVNWYEIRGERRGIGVGSQWFYVLSYILLFI